MRENERSGRPGTDRRRFLGYAAAAGVVAGQVGLPGPAVAATPGRAAPAGAGAAAGWTPRPGSGIRPFRIHVRQRDLGELRRRVKETRWPDRETVADRSQGAQLARMRPLMHHWGTSTTGAGSRGASTPCRSTSRRSTDWTSSSRTSVPRTPTPCRC